MDVTKASKAKLEELAKEYGKKSDYQSVRAFVVISDELDRREKRRKK